MRRRLLITKRLRRGRFSARKAARQMADAKRPADTALCHERSSHLVPSVS